MALPSLHKLVNGGSQILKGLRVSGLDGVYHAMLNMIL